MTRDDLQPSRMDTNGNIRCDWYDDRTGQAGFYCTACGWDGVVKRMVGEDADVVRDRAAEMHDREA